MNHRKRRRARPSDRDPSVGELLRRAADALEQDADPNLLARVVSNNDQLAASLRDLARNRREKEQ